MVFSSHIVFDPAATLTRKRQATAVECQQTSSWIGKVCLLYLAAIKIQFRNTVWLSWLIFGLLGLSHKVHNLCSVFCTCDLLTYFAVDMVFNSNLSILCALVALLAFVKPQDTADRPGMFAIYSKTTPVHSWSPLYCDFIHSVVLCNRELFDNYCPEGRVTDNRGCPTEQCIEDPCYAVRMWIVIWFILESSCLYVFC